MLGIQASPMSEREIRGQSFGAITRAGKPGPDWREQRGSLLDPAVFGYRHDFRCACGLFLGEQHNGLICHVCAVKVGSRSARFRRFGHIELKWPAPHPLAVGAELSVIPVIPIGFRSVARGLGLNALYSDVLRADSEKAEAQAVERLFTNEQTNNPRQRSGFAIVSLLGNMTGIRAGEPREWVYMRALAMRLTVTGARRRNDRE